MFVLGNSPTTLRQSSCKATVQVKLMFENRVVTGGVPMSNRQFERMTTCWRDAAQQIWNNQWLYPMSPHRWLCSEVWFDFQMNWGSAQSDWHHVIVKADLPSGAYVIGPTDSNPQATVHLDVDDGHDVVAHEIGHVLWLGDEYLASTTPTSAGHDINADPPYCLMMKLDRPQIYVAKDHVASIMAKLNASMNLCCCLWPNPLQFLRALVERWQLPGPPPEAPTPISPGDLDDPQIFTLIDGASGTDLAILGNYVGLDFSVDADLALSELQASTVRRRWLAAIALGNIEDGRVENALRKALLDPDVSVRVHAARSLHLHGSRDGVPVLLKALGSDDVVIREPPILARSYANRLLQRISGTSFGFDPHASPKARLAAIARWQAWWDALQ